VARIRTIKPEILTDEKTAALSDTEWRLFVSCVVMADDYGNLRASPAFIHSQVFWSSSTSREASRKALETLASLSLLQLYVVSGQQYGHVIGWAKHQRVDHPGKPVCPGPEQAQSTTYADSSRDPRETGGNIPETLAPDRDLEGEGDGRAPKKLRPSNANNLIWCIKVAVEAQPMAKMWAAEPLAAKNADEFLHSLGDVKKALPDLERRIELFAKDPDMQPWTVKKFCEKYNGIGLPKLEFGRAPKATEVPAQTPVLE
jgi:hypothetical protein